MEDGQVIPVWMNQVTPRDNPSETYAYYDLPFPCKPAEFVGPGPESLGEILEGDRFVLAPFQVEFGKSVDRASLCDKQKLTQADIAVLRDLVEKFSTFSMVIDDLPVAEYVGFWEVDVAAGEERTRFFLNTHFDFSFGVNGNQIVELNLTMSDVEEHPVELAVGQGDVDVEFTYTVRWSESQLNFAERLGHQELNLALLFPLYDSEAPSQIRWFSILNAFMLIWFLVTFIALILLRILRRDYNKLEKMHQTQSGDGEADDVDDDIGWKKIHGSVFRYPKFRTLFSSLVGVGVQFVALIFSLVFLVVMGVYSNYHSGALMATAIVLYALTAVLAGWFSAAWYKRMGGESWLRNLLLTTLLYALPFWIVGSFLNSVALGYHSTRALPFGTIVAIIAIWAAVAFPLTMVGGVLARRYAAPWVHPTETRMLPSGIPQQSWFQALPVQMTVAGFLPFTAIYLELYYIFSSVWGRQLYTLYGVLLLAFLVMVVVTACICICLVYFQLSGEDYRWWWRSMLCGGSTAVFVLLYAIYFYAYQSMMNGFFQASFYFGAVGLAAYGLFIMLGFVGYYASHVFVNRIYSAMKTR